VTKPAPKFYVLTPGSEERKWAERIDPWKQTPVICPLNPDHKRGRLRSGDAVFKVPGGSIDDDIIWSWESDCIVSERVVELLTQKNTTGVSFRRTMCLNLRRRFLPLQYWILEPSGWGGYAQGGDEELEVEYCKACELTIYRFPKNLTKSFAANQWDGSDIFRIWPVGLTCVMPKVAQLLSDFAIASVQDPAAIRFPKDAIVGGRLTDYLTLEKACEVARKEYHI
jgi:hypothetical protein